MDVGSQPITLVFTLDELCTLRSLLAVSVRFLDVAPAETQASARAAETRSAFTKVTAAIGNAFHSPP